MHKPQVTTYESALLLFLERYRRQMSKVAKTDPAPRLTFSNIDIKTLLILYLEEFPKEVQQCWLQITKDDLSAFSVGEHKLSWRFTPIYSEMWTEYEKASNSLTGNSICYGDYQKTIDKLELVFVNKFKEEFRKAVLCTPLAKKRLTKHLDTLLFTCVYFYNAVWDSQGITFNKPKGSTTLSQRANNVSQLLASLYKNEQLKKIQFIINGQTITWNDTALNNWLIKILEESVLNDQLPHSMRGISSGLKAIVAFKRRGGAKRELLNALEAMCTFQSDDYTNHKRKAVKLYCELIHKIFSFYMELPEEQFDNKRPLIYSKILKTFGMEDFSIALRNHNQSIDVDIKRDLGSNRLAELLRRERK